MNEKMLAVMWMKTGCDVLSMWCFAVCLRGDLGDLNCVVSIMLFLYIII